MRISDWSSDVCSSDLVGSESTATGLGDVAMGAKAKAEGGSSVAIGGAFNTFAGWAYTAATGTQGVAVGAGAKASGDYGTAIGPVPRPTAFATTARAYFPLASGEHAPTHTQRSSP